MDNQALLLNIARFCPSTHSLGPGQRAAIWVQGCARRKPCPGCIAPEWLEFKPNRLVSPAQLVDQIFESGAPDGLTFSGGEPMEQAEGLALLARLAKQRKPEINIISFSGYQYEQLLKSPPNPGVPMLLNQVDVLVDGPYIHNLNNGLGLRGSQNQRFLHLTDRLRHVNFENYPRQVEILLDGNEISMVGIPPLGIESVLEIFTQQSTLTGKEMEDVRL